jgi:hypothetical protein
LAAVRSALGAAIFFLWQAREIFTCVLLVQLKTNTDVEKTSRRFLKKLHTKQGRLILIKTQNKLRMEKKP